MSAEVDKDDLKQLFKKLEALGKAVTGRKRKRALRRGAELLRDTARANIPKSDKPHKVYGKNPVAFGRHKAPPGKGRVLMVIHPGNARAALQVISLRKSPDLFVGPTKNRKKLPVGFYLPWLEFGARNVDGTRRPGFAFMRRALASTKQKVKSTLAQDIARLIEREVKRLRKQNQ